MSASFMTRLKNGALRALSALTKRHAVLLPAEAATEEGLLDLRAPYRVEGSRLVVELREVHAGSISATLLAYRGHFPTRRLWTAAPRRYEGPCDLTLDIPSGAVTLAGVSWGRVDVPLPGRRFCWRLDLLLPDGRRRSRMTGHYVPAPSRTIGESYFHGDNYVDHEAEAAGEHPRIVDLAVAHRLRPPVLEIGCATGGLLAALDAAGIQAVGLDVSSWAIERARARIGRECAWVCDVERDPLPAPVKEAGPFGGLVLASVLEHFEDPFAVLAGLTPHARQGAALIVTTTNADSLTHRLFGSEWEGYFDSTHRGVDLVGVQSLRRELPRLGWRIVELSTRAIWDGSADPTRATLREWWASDARFQGLLAERDLGDLVTCVAVKS